MSDRQKKYEKQLEAQRNKIKVAYEQRDMDEMKSKMKELEELVERTNTATSSTNEPTNIPVVASRSCSHEFVNIGFSSRKMVCKHCDMDE